MLYEKIYLYENEEDVTLEIYSCDTSDEYAINKHPAVLIMPGGAYAFCSDREAEPVARFFMSQGFNCGILRYSVKEKASIGIENISRPLLEASKALSIMRENAQKWNIEEDKIAVCGFSAGGHLAASLGTLWDDDKIFENLDIKRGSNKPNALILSYPVIRTDELSHRASVEWLLGEHVDEEKLMEKYDLTKHVSDKTPNTFIWHTYTDQGVPVENSLSFCEAMRKHSKSSCELHIFHEGGHGMCICTKEVGTFDKHVAHWCDLCIEWLNKQFNM